MPTAASRTDRRGPTIRAVAGHAGVSRQTVSNAINNPQRLTPSTLARVSSSIEELGYRPNEAGRSLTSRTARALAISVGRADHDPSASLHPLLDHLVALADAQGYRIVLSRGGADPGAELAAYHDAWRRGAVDGVVLMDTRPRDPRPAWLGARGIPLAAMGRPWGDAGAQHPWIDVDMAAGLRAAVDHVVGRGRTSVAFLGWGADGAGGDERLRGWREGLLAHPPPDHLVVHADHDDLDAAQVVTAGLLRTAGVDAIACASDTLAVGACRAVEDAGLVPGRDVDVTGYDDSLLARSHRPALTSVRQPLDQVARFLVASLVGAIEGSEPGPPGPAMVEPSLVVRASSGSPLA